MFKTDTPHMNKNRLRVLRAEHRLTQMAVARRIRIGTYRYWQIENGYAQATSDERAALAKVFKVNPQEVFPEAVAS
jgi:transcriptional regulator with XRE-family HTH domain